MKNLYLICLLFIISACGTPTTEERITFTQVDPFLKVFRESNFFPEYDEGIKRVAVVGGGVGCAIAYPQAKKLHSMGEIGRAHV